MAHPYVRPQEGFKSMKEIPGNLPGWPIRRAGQGHRRASSQQQGRYLLLCARRNTEEHCQSPTKWPPTGYRCACFWPNCQKQTPWGWNEGWTSSSGICAHRPEPCSSICICRRTLEWAELPLVSCSLQMRKGSHWARDWHEKVWRRSGERYAACNIIQHDWLGGGSVMVWVGRYLEGHTDLDVIANGTLTAVRYQDVLMLVQWALGSSWCRTMPGFMWPECVGSSWMMKVLMPLTCPHVSLT